MVEGAGEELGMRNKIGDTSRKIKYKKWDSLLIIIYNLSLIIHNSN